MMEQDRLPERNHVDSDDDKITLIAIELATKLKYGSNQSRQYLDEAKRIFMKQNKK